MAVHKFSRQRECIREYLRSRKDHPTADMIYRAVQEKYPSISLGTIYRNLSLMASEGDIIKICVGEGVEHYDAFTQPHDHFRCTRCGCILDLNTSTIANLDSMANRSFAGKIESHSLMFYGICPDCLAEEKTEKEQCS